MIWGKPPFSIPDNCAVDVRNLAAARNWYREKLGLHDSNSQRDEDSGRPFADMCISDDDGAVVALVELEPGASPGTQHVIFYASKLEKARQWLTERGVTAEPVTTDPGGNHFFRFRDLDGNAIEVCIEPS